MNRALIAFAIAALAAMAGMAGWAALVGGATLAIALERAPMVYLFTPFVGLALFQLFFGALAARWRTWRYWAIGVPFTTVFWALAISAMLARALSPAQALTLVVAAHLAFGLLAMRITAAPEDQA